MDTHSFSLHPQQTDGDESRAQATGAAGAQPLDSVADHSAAAVELTDLTKSFGANTAVDGLTLTIPRGKVTSLLGPNGAGKTTTIEMCEGFLRPDSGTLRVLGLDPLENSTQLRSRIGIMLQGGGAYPGIRVGELVELTASYSAHPLDVPWLIDLVGLSGLEKTTYKSLSGGQQQRLSLACALVGRPELVFLDEPTAGLDAQARHLVWELVEALRADGVAVVLTTHHLDEAEALSDQVFIIQKGRLVASGSPAELQRTARERSAPHVRVVIDRAAAQRDSSISEVVNPAVLAQRASQHGLTLTAEHIRTEDDGAKGADTFLVATQPTAAAFASLASACADLHAPLIELSAAAPSLEDIFLDLTGKDA